MPGLIINGAEVAVDGLTIINKNDASWASMSGEDYGTRNTSWVRQVILHTTKGNWPQTVLPGKGPGGAAKRTADMWRDDSTCAGAHIVIDDDGTVACLCDLQKQAAWHATVSNMYSIGIEMYQEAADASGNWGIYEAVLDSAVILVPALCKLFGIQFQVPGRTYNNQPIQRMVGGGSDMVGVFGHRDNTGDRGQGDPGDEIFNRLADLGAERYDYDGGEDLTVWKQRQQALVDGGANITVDGIAGPGTFSALKAAGGATGIWVFDHHA